MKIIVFAKAPIAGVAKTRLASALGPDRAAALARRMLDRTVRTAMRSGIGTVELCVTPDASAGVWRTIGVPPGVIWSDQGDGDLGDRMARAAARAIGGGDSALLIGTDCPGLDSDCLQRAARALGDHDAVLVPTTDGGYALLGLRSFHPDVFANIAWSTADVRRETLRRIESIGWTVDELPELRDIDAPADLPWLPDEWRRELGLPADPP